MSDNRARPRIHRTDDKHDKALRDYAAEHGIEPWQALEIAIRRLEIPDVLPRDARADLDSAREATRRADAEVERLTRERDTERRLDVAAQEALRADVAREIETNRKLEAELAKVRAALETKGATDRLAERVETIAAALPDDFEAKLTERAPGWKGTLAELRARVITLGFSRYDALATDAAKRAAERGR